MVADYGLKKNMTPVFEESDVERISKDVETKVKQAVIEQWKRSQ